MYVVILAGGGGTRLHPLSTPARPKPFLPLLGGRTLLQDTVSRLDGPELGGVLDVSVLASTAYAPLVRDQLPGIDVVEEPEARNTAAAIALASLAIDRPDDDVMVVLPADHAIAEAPLFRSVLARAASGLAGGAFGIESPLVTLGVQVDRPATEYGYLRPRIEEGGRRDGLVAYPLLAFEEKPDEARAAELASEPGVAWNAGMFLWRRRAIRDALEAYAPDILGGVADALAVSNPAQRAERYGAVRATSIDYAVMEPAARDGSVVMAAMDVGWSDIGSWSALLTALGSAGPSGRVVQPGESVVVGSDDLVVRRRDGVLVLEAGPRAGILDPDEPTALLTAARADRSIVGSLLARCSASEMPA